jgi:hypothetical protein
MNTIQAVTLPNGAMHPDPNHAGHIWSLLSASSLAAWFGPVMAGVPGDCVAGNRGADFVKPRLCSSTARRCHLIRTDKC